jgi:hypothetical protein
MGLGPSRTLGYVRAAQSVMGPPGAFWLAMERGTLEAFLFVLILLLWEFAIRIVCRVGHAAGLELGDRVHRPSPNCPPHRRH